MALIDGKRYKDESHAHCRLRFYLKAPEPYNCDGCMMPGFGPCLKCPHQDCDFHLHQLCYNIQTRLPNLRTKFFDQCGPFDLCKSLPKDSDDHNENVPYCDACGLDILGFRYRCNQHENPHDLHPVCGDLDPDEDYRIMNGVKLKLQDKVNSKCMYCNKRYPVKAYCKSFRGWKWVSEKRGWAFPDCFTGKKICYHLTCMEDIRFNEIMRKKSSFSTGMTKSVNLE